MHWYVFSSDFEISVLQLQPAYRSQFEHDTAENGLSLIALGPIIVAATLLPQTSRVPN